MSDSKPAKQMKQGSVKDLTQRQKRAKAPKPLRVETSSGKSKLTFQVPDCAAHYLAAAVNPFEAEAGACLPAETFPLPSRKVKAFARTTMKLGTSGVGFVQAKCSTANDSWVINATGSTSVGTKASLLSAFTNTVQTNATQLPYTTAQISGSSVASRAVAYGLRLKYIGKLMDRNGVTISYEDPDNVSVDSSTWDSLSGSPYTTIKRIGSDEWDAHVCYSGPVTPSDLEFVGGTATPRGNLSTMVIMVSGVAGDEYEVEFYIHIEYVGTIVIGKTPSHAEPSMFAKAVQAIKTVTADRALEPGLLGTIWSRFKGFVSESLPAIATTVAGAVTRNPSLMGAGATQVFGNVAKYIMTPSAEQNLQIRNAKRLGIA